MAVSRQANLLGGQRCDVPHLRQIESAVAADFDLLAGTMLAGRKPMVVSGFQLITTGITLASNLQLQVAGSSLIHFYASESGSIYQAPADRAIETLNSVNPRVIGSFTPSQLNFVGIDLIRSADSTTSDLVKFIDTNTLTETPETVPLARTLDYRIVISTTDFDATPGLVPIARVQVNAAGVITQVEDSRNIMWRLGLGGTSPDPLNTFPWPGGRKEGLITADFTGGDKAITSLKGWMDAVATRLFELGGGEHWYSQTEDHNVTMGRTGSPFVSSGEYFEWSGTNLHWKGLVFNFANTTAIYNTVSDQITDVPTLTDLLSGECIYVDVDRSANVALTAVKAPLALLGSPDVPGSRWVLAWCYGTSIYVRDQSYAVGSSFKLATIAAAGAVLLSADDISSPAIVAMVDSVNYIAHAAGLTREGSFVGGLGDIVIGGFGSRDRNTVLRTYRDQDEVKATGSHNYGTGQAAAFSVTNTDDFTAHSTNLSARFGGHNAGTGFDEDAHQFECGGAMSWRNVLSTPQTPAPTATRPQRNKTFFRDNSVASPNKRDQFCILAWNGKVSVLWESETY